MPGLVQLLAAAAPAEPDADLLARFRSAGDADAFAELVRRHGPAVLGTCRRLVGRSAADDAFQATFLVLAARAGSVRKAASVGSWLVGVAGRVGRRMRQRDRRQETGDRGQGTGDRSQSEPVCLLSPDSCLLADELGEVLADEFTRLPDKLRAAAVACLLDGRTQDQAAAALGWSSRTVRRRLDEAKEVLRTRLERRGITPAAAVAAVAAAGEAVAVPAPLARKTTDGATLFLAGGGADLPAAALASGVLGTMTTIRSTAAAALCVAVLAGVGVGWANDAAPPAESDRIPAPAASAAPPAPAAGPHVHKAANFEVTAPTAAVARAVAEEFERQRKKSAIAWSGAELPAWKEPVTIRLEPSPKDASQPYRADIQFRALRQAGDGGGFGGSLESFLNWYPPVIADRFVVHTLLDRLPPWWAEFPLWLVANPDAKGDFWAHAVRPVRRQLEDGAALRLAALLRADRKSGDDAARDQGTTVVGFLLCQAVGGRGAPPRPTAESRRALIRFLKAGGDGDWDRAAKDVYGFASLRELERAWIDWVRAEPGLPLAAPDPDRIPPPDAGRPPPDRRGHTALPNFVVTAPSLTVAEAVGVAAERHRREVAKRWLGAELPDAAVPVPVTVTITAGGSGGATTFTFGEADGKRPPGVRTAAMELRGTLDRVLKSVLPHEVTHVVLATHFGRPLPRWADEGMALLAEAEADRFDHEVRARELLNAGRGIRLDTLFRMTEYPRDSVVTFAQGHSVCRFLLERGAAGARVDAPRFRRGDREPALVAFLTMGMEANTAESWANAAKAVYGFDSVDALEQAWIDSLRTPPVRR